MTGRKRRKNGAVARTALSLLGLGLGSAVFGAVVVGPVIGKKITEENHAGRRTTQPTQDDRERLLRDALGLHSGDRAAESTSSTETSSSRVHLTSSEEPSRTRTASRDTEPDEPAPREEAAPTTRTDNARPTRVTADEDAPVVKPERDAAHTKSASRREETTDDEDATPRARTERASDKHSRRAAASDEPSSRPIVAEPAEPRAVSTAETRRADRRTSHDDTPAPTRKHEDDVRVADASATAPAADAEPEGAKLYRVRVGKFESREDAEKLRDELKETAGVTAFLVKVPDGYQVQTGAYKHRSNAEKIAGNLRSHSYRPKVTQE